MAAADEEDLRWAATLNASSTVPLDPWQVIDVSSWSEVSPENRGKRSKCWVAAPDGVRWLRKEPWISRPYEAPVETLALRLARASGLPAPRCHPCVWQSPEGERRGIVVRAFADVLQEGTTAGGAQLLDGAVLLARSHPEYRPDVHPMHTLTRVRRVLERLEAAHNTPLLQPFMQLMAFDLWLGNTDRHQHNWSILQVEDRVCMAPMYDPAACLGVELTDGHRLLDADRRTAELVARYRKNAQSGFGDEMRLIRLEAVALELCGWPGWTENVKPALAAFRAVMDTHVCPFLRSIPVHWLPDNRKHFAELLLRERLSWFETLRCQESSNERV
jgi:hypothetical protein